MERTISRIQDDIANIEDETKMAEFIYDFCFAMMYQAWQNWKLIDFLGGMQKYRVIITRSTAAFSDVILSFNPNAAKFTCVCFGAGRGSVWIKCLNLLIS